MDTKKKKFYISIALNCIAVLALLTLLLTYGRIFYYEAKYTISSLYSEDIKNSKKYYDGLPRSVAAGREIQLKPIVAINKPANRDFSIMIPKLGINHAVVPDVDINNEAVVADALKSGIGWAKGTVEPGSEGNSLIFSHSTVNAWDIWRYNAEFTLLRKLEINDTFSVVYQDRQMDFIIFEKKIVPAEDKSYLTSAADGRIVTLQTCHPPGDNSSRLLIRGRLVAMEVK